MAEMTLSPGWATYLRVSDEDKQTPERSFAMQRQRIGERLIASSGIPVYREYRDLLTGTSANRADYQQLLLDAKAGYFSHLGLYRADRFGRDTVEGLQAATNLISLGIKIRIAHMPSLMPETPDGFFMFLMQMGLAQREVDVMRNRVRDGTEAKLRAGGWPNRAPTGYVNKERQISSSKYERWVEQDPMQAQGLREAWNILLTGAYSLSEICDELTARGFTRKGGRPWAWDDPGTGNRRNARNTLHAIFHNPFYAGWVVSEPFNIEYGEIRGRWEPLVTTDEYERGIQLLAQSQHTHTRKRRHSYLLRSLIWIQVNGQPYKMYGSTPSSQTRQYSYYVTRFKPLDGRRGRIRCETVDDQIPELLQSIAISSEQLPIIRELYETHIRDEVEGDLEASSDQIKHQLAKMKSQQTQLTRLFLEGVVEEEEYKQLRAEWQEKIRHQRLRLREAQREIGLFIDDLDIALALLQRLSDLYTRLTIDDRSQLLRILLNRIIVDDDGEIIDYDLNAPFTYLTTLMDGPQQGPNGTLSRNVQQSPH